MKLVNNTSAVTHFYPVNLLEEELRAALIVKKTYALGDDGKLTDVDVEPLPLVPDILATDFGQFHGEIFFRKRGADVCVLGTARFETPVREATVRLEVGAWHHELRLVGDRRWVRGANGQPVASSPATFSEMPLSYERAFGGAAKVNGEDVAWPDNPVGRGYFDTPEEALGKPLPNIELPTPRAAEPRWDVRPSVAGWGPYPMFWGLRGSRAVTVDQKSGQILEIKPELFNHAHPDLILETLEPGAPVRITGMRARPITLAVPRECPHVAVRVGEKRFEAWGELDGLFVWVDAARVVVTWRARFRYAVRTEELREAVLTFAEPPAPETTRGKV